MTWKTLQSIAQTQKKHGVPLSAEKHGAAVVPFDAIVRLSATSFGGVRKVLAAIQVLRNAGVADSDILNPESWPLIAVDVREIGRDPDLSRRAEACDSFVIQAIHEGHTDNVADIIAVRRRFMGE